MKSNRLLINTLILAFFIIFAFYNFYEILFLPNWSVTNSADGIAGIGWMYFYWEVLKEGNSLLTPHLFFTDKIGLGLMNPGYPSLIWTGFVSLLGNIVNYPDNIYDGMNFGFFILNGLVAYLFLRSFGVSVFFSVLAGLLFLHTDNLYARLDGHLGMGFCFLEIITIWSGIRTAQKLTFLNLSIFTILFGLVLQNNPYYGYYGFFFIVTLVISYFLAYNKTDKNNFFILLIKLLFVCIFGVIVLSAFFPTIIFPKVLNLFGHTANQSTIIDESIKYERNLAELNFYSTKKFFYLFSPSIELLQKLFPTKHLKKDIWELTYRIGFIPFITVITYLFYALFKTKSESRNIHYVLWLPACLLITLFGLHTDSFFSLVPFTYKIAPMFRVGVRAYLYLNISFIIFFCITLDILWKKSYLFTNQKKRYVIHFPIIILAILGFQDLSKYSLFSKIPAKQLPDSEIYSALQKNPKRLLLELPLYSTKYIQEYSYIYVFNYIYHKQPVVNFPISNQFFKHYKAYNDLDDYLSDISDLKLQKLCNAGLQYITVRFPTQAYYKRITSLYKSDPKKICPIEINNSSLEKQFDFKLLDKSQLLRKITKNDHIKIYEFKEKCNGDIQTFRTQFLKGFE